jgi:NitT/TauT family transport system substrate-binding protein
MIPMRGIRALLCILAACLVAAGPVIPAQGQGLTTVRMALLPVQSWAPVFIAMDEGFFQRFGLKVEFVVFSTGAEAIPVLVDGKLDIGAGNLSAAFFNALARGIPVRVVADKGRSGPGDKTNALMVRKDLWDSGQIRTVADLRGRRVGIDGVGGSQQYVLYTALQQAQLKPGDIREQRMPQPAIAAALEGKALDAGVLAEPRVTFLIERGAAVPLRYYSDVLPQLQIGVIQYGTNFLQKNRALGVRWMAGYLLGLRRYAEGKTPRNVAIIAKYTDLDQATLRKSFWFPINADGRPDGLSLMRMQDWMYGEGLINVRVPAQQFIDNSFLQDAEALLGG